MGLRQVACSVLLLVGFSSARQAPADPPIGDCAIKRIEQTLGPGCCNLQPAECDYYVYTYVAICEGACPVGKDCVEIGTGLRLTYDYKDCSGSCPDDCETNESTTTYSTVTTECGCRPVR